MNEIAEIHRIFVRVCRDRWIFLNQYYRVDNEGIFSSKGAPMLPRKSGWTSVHGGRVRGGGEGIVEENRAGGREKRPSVVKRFERVPERAIFTI